jgi:hypothetical protein
MLRPRQCLPSWSTLSGRSLKTAAPEVLHPRLGGRKGRKLNSPSLPKQKPHRQLAAGEPVGPAETRVTASTFRRMGWTGRSGWASCRGDADCLDGGRKRAARAIQSGEIDLTLRFTLQGFMKHFDYLCFFEKPLQPVKVGRR